MRLPRFIAPQLATSVDKAPPGDEWLHEIKFDGYRMIGRLEGGKVTLFSRNAIEWTEKVPSIARAIAALPARQAFIDGEVLCFDREGRSSFEALKNALGTHGEAKLVFHAFDLLILDDQDLRARSLLERKSVLKELISRTPNSNDNRIRYTDHKEGDGTEFLEAACEHGLEGIISKRVDARYVSGRGVDWLKIKCMRRQEFVVVGYTPPSREGYKIGSLILAVHDDRGDLVYAGRVGTGFDLKERRRLKEQLDRLSVPTSPLKSVPREPGLRGTRWARAALVAEIEYTEWTRDGRLRHPSYKGLREDKEESAVIREKEKDVRTVIAQGKGSRLRASKQSADPTIAGVRLTNPDRVLYPEQQITKLTLAKYYVAVQKLMLPHLARRPLTLVRCPEGYSKECFFQKHPGTPAPHGVSLVPIKEEKATTQYMWLKDLKGIVGLVQLGTLEFHIWGSRVDRVEQPDRIAFDFDPAVDVPFRRVVEAAFSLRERLKSFKLTSFVMSTGGKGLHVIVPIERRRSFDDVKRFAHAIAAAVVREAPGEYVAEASLRKRKGKIFVDYLRNSRGATAICPYSTRAREGAPVAAPLTWDELRNEAEVRFDCTSMLSRVARMKKDPWADYGKVKQRLTEPILKRALEGEF